MKLSTKINRHLEMFPNAQNPSTTKIHENTHKINGANGGDGEGMGVGWGGGEEHRILKTNYPAG